MNRKLKIGIDIHGVTDSNLFFKAMAIAMLKDGHEIHVITGANRIKAKKDLHKCGMTEGRNYTTLFSITDHLLETSKPIDVTDTENPRFLDLEWDRTKAIYCEENKIDMHFDDSSIYGSYFVTPYAQVSL